MFVVLFWVLFVFCQISSISTTEMFLSLFTSRWFVLFIVIGLPDRNLEPFPSACGLTLVPLANYDLPPGHWALPTACTHPPPGAVNIENYSCETDPRSLIISVVCPRHRHRTVASWSHTGRETNGAPKKIWRKQTIS